MDGLNKAEEVVGSAGGIAQSLGEVAESIGVVSDGDGLILRNSGIGSERNVEPGDLLSGVIGIGLVGQVEVEVSGIDGLAIDGDREGVFDVIDLSLCLCELLREGDGEGGASGIDSSGAAEGWRVGIDGGVIGDLLREGVRGVAGQIGDTNGVIGCDIGVGEQEALSFWKEWASLRLIRRVRLEVSAGSSCVRSWRKVAALCCPSTKSLRSALAKEVRLNFLVEFELESFAISEELNALHARHELRPVVVGSASR